MESFHIPVLLEEVQHYLQPRTGGIYVDGTLGHGGHTAMLLEQSAPSGRVIGIDRDARNIQTAQARLKDADRLTVVQDDYRNLAAILERLGVEKVDGILLDVGFSSAHVDDATRGFSFMQDGPLDMRYDTDQELTAAMVVNSWSEEQLTHAFLVYGEEERARQAAKSIVARRREQPFRTTTDLAETLAATLGRRGKTHPATRVFQALRIVVNDELGAIETVLPQAMASLTPGGRLAVISFHSLEDRIVKRFFKARPDVQILTKKPVVPTGAEVNANPRARSAKLRVVAYTGPKHTNNQHQHDRFNTQEQARHRSGGEDSDLTHTLERGT